LVRLDPDQARLSHGRATRACWREDVQVPFCNRVTPFGDLLAVPERGTLTGNRGVLHDPEAQIVRRWQVRRWITCDLRFRGRHRQVMAPRRYTHLFFLDEATALAAGHRPCAECRRADYEAFRRCWASAHRRRESLPSADAMDAVLHRERALVDGRRRTWPAAAADLPDGTFAVLDDDPWLLRSGSLWRWTPGGYRHRRPAPPVPLAVLTPPSTVAALRAGYPVSPETGLPSDR
jgi:hypothetical protein